VQVSLDALGILVDRDAPRDRTDQIADHANGHLAPFDELFHQRGLLISPQDKFQLFAQFCFVVDNGVVTDAHARAFPAGFNEQWKGHALIQGFIHPLKGLKLGGGQAVPG